MSLKTTIDADIKKAMLAKNKEELEALRSMMFGTEIFIIDPENEYQRMCEAVAQTEC